MKNVPDPTRGSFLVPVPDPPGTCTTTTRGSVPAGHTRYPLGSITTGVHSCHCIVYTLPEKDMLSSLIAILSQITHENQALPVRRQVNPRVRVYQHTSIFLFFNGLLDCVYVHDRSAVHDNLFPSWTYGVRENVFRVIFSN